jgi:hypothetical protein
MNLLKKLSLSAIIVFVTASCVSTDPSARSTASVIGGTVNSVLDKPITLGEANYFPQSTEDIEISKIVKDLHKTYHLFVADYEQINPEAGIIDVTGFRSIENTLKKKMNHATVYSTLEISKNPAADEYVIDYQPYGEINKIRIHLLPKYKISIDKIFSILKTEELWVNIYGAESFGRGGYHLITRGLSNADSFLLSCKKISYDDGSGSDRCLIKIKDIDFSKKDISVYINSKINGKVDVPAEDLKKGWSNKYK